MRVVFSPNLSELPDLDETTARLVFKVAFYEPSAVIKLKPFLGALALFLHQTGPYLKYGWLKVIWSINTQVILLR